MTRKESLAELIAKVEAGDATNDGSMFRVFGDKWTTCFDAFHGSLDAAKALHDAVLPEYGYGVIGTMSDGDCRACVVPKIDNPPEYHGRSEIPARAWLLAILRALHSMEAES